MYNYVCQVGPCEQNRSVPQNFHTSWHQAFELSHAPFAQFISIFIASGARLQSYRQSLLSDKSLLKERKAYSSLYQLVSAHISWSVLVESGKSRVNPVQNT